MKTVIYNPYSQLPDENWTPYRSQMVADTLSKNGHQVDVLVSKLRHNSQIQREVECIENEKVTYVVQRKSVCIKYSNVGVSRALFEAEYALYFIFVYLLRRLRRNQIDLIIVVEPAPVASLILHFVLALARIRVKIVYDVLDLFPEGYFQKIKTNFFGKLIVRSLKTIRGWRLKSADGIIFCSETYKSLLRSDVQSKTVYIGSNKLPEIKKEYFKGHYPDIYEWIHKDTRSIICYAGTIGHGYALHNFVQQFIDNSAILRDYRLMIIGSGPNEIVAKIKDLARPDFNRVFVHSSIEHHFLPYIYEVATYGLISYADGSSVSMPLKFFDYVNYDLKIINNSTGEAAELIRTNKLGVNATLPNWLSLSDDLESLEAGIRIDQAKLHNLKSAFQYESLYKSYCSFLTKVAGKSE